MFELSSLIIRGEFPTVKLTDYELYCLGIGLEFDEDNTEWDYLSNKTLNDLITLKEHLSSVSVSL